MERTVAADLEDLELKQSEVFKSWKELNSQASNVLAFTLRWDGLQKHFDSARKTLQTGLESLSEREKAVASREEQVKARESRFIADFTSKTIQLKLIEKSIVDRGVYLQSLESSIQEHREGLDAEERKLASVQKSVAEKNEEFERLKNSVEWVEHEFSVLKLRFKRKSKATESIQETLRAYKDDIELENRTFQALRSSIEDRKREAELKETQLRAFQVSLDKCDEDIKSKEEKLNKIENAIVLCWNELKLKAKHLESAQSAAKSKEELVVSLKNTLAECSKELELKEKQIELVKSKAKSKEEIVASLENKIAECSNELEIANERLESVQREAKRREDSFFFLKKSVEQYAQEFEQKEKKMEGLMKKFEATETSCEVKIKEAHLIYYKVNASLEEVNARDSDVESLRKSLIACLSEVEARENNVESLRKSVEEHSLRLQTEERLLRERVSEFESRQKESCSSRKSTEARSVQVKIEHVEQAHPNTSTVPITNEGSNIQLILNLQLQKHDSVCKEAYDVLRASSNPAEFVLGAMEGFYPSQLNGEAEEFDVRIVRRSCILLLEKLTEFAPRINSQVKDKALKLANDWISRSKQTEMDYLEASGIVQLINSYGLASEVDSNDRWRLLNAVGQYGLSSELRQAVSTSDQASAVPRIEIAAENLLADLATSFSNDPWSVVHVKILKFLQTSPDPASHVLYFIESSFSQNWQTGNLAIRSKFMNHCVCLFEQLLKISPPIQPRVTYYAMKLAVEWKGKIQTASEVSWDIHAFLQFLHTYGLFSRKRLCDEALGECNAVGFADEVLGFIQNLIETKKPVDAVNLIYALNLTDKFSPVSVLRSYLKDVTDPSRKKYLKEKTIEEQEKATEEEITALENVTNCVNDHAPTLSKIPVDQILKRITYLRQRKDALTQDHRKQIPTCKKRVHSAISHQSESDSRRNKLAQKGPSSCPSGFVSHVEVPFDTPYDTTFRSTDAPS